MPNHVLKFDRPLKKVVLVPTTSRSSILDSEAKNSVNQQKLAKTDSGQVAKSAPHQADLPKLFLKISQQIEQLKQLQNEPLQQQHEFSIRLAIQIASAVVRYEVGHHESRIRALLETFLEQHEPQCPVVVRVNKTDMDRLLISLPDAPSLDSAIQLKQDDSVLIGDCRIDSPQFGIVASWARQLDEIQEQLMETLDDARLGRENSDSKTEAS